MFTLSILVVRFDLFEKKLTKKLFRNVFFGIFYECVAIDQDAQKNTEKKQKKNREKFITLYHE